MLLSATQLLAFTDKIAFQWERLKPVLGSTADNPPAAGTCRKIAADLLGVVTTAGDYEIESDLNTPCANALTACGVETWLATFSQAITALAGHCQHRGAEVNAAITGLTSYLNYLNTAPTGAPFASLLAPGFADLYAALFAGQALPAGSFYQRGISPALNPATQPNGMGARAVGGAFAAGVQPDVARYAAVRPLVVVTADFVGGTAPPTVTLAGTDSAGATTTVWTMALDSNNPAAAVATTITPAVAALARQTPAVASAAGITPGQALTVNAGLPDQEVIVAEAVGAGTVTAVFQQAHAAGATLTGGRAYAPPPSVAGLRMAALTGITLGLTGHTGGAVRVDGAQERRAV